MIHFEVVTPDRRILKEVVDEVQIPGKGGYLGILPGHAPLITELQIGKITYRKGTRTSYLSVDSGYCEVLSDKVTVLAEKAERGDEIDLNRAMSSRARAEKRLADIQNPEIDFVRAMASLQRALARIDTCEKMRETLL